MAIADRLGPFTLAPLTDRTRSALAATLARERLEHIVGVRNPLDVTPLLDDAGYESVVRAVLEDDTVDAAVVGCVPLTQALQTLPAGPGHDEDLARAGGIVPRLARLWGCRAKPWVAVVDAGERYDAMARALEAAGIPTFRAADRALRLFARWCQARLPHA